MRKSLKDIRDSLHMMWQLDKIVFLSALAEAVIGAVTPFAGILLSAHILDGLANRTPFHQLLLVSSLAVGGVFLLTVLKAWLEAQKSVHMEICVRRFDMKMSERTLTMDYELLDSPAVNDIRTRIQNDNNWGSGFYSMIYGLPFLIQSMVGTVVSLVILIPLFLDGALFHDPLALGLLAAFLLVAVGSAVSSYKNKNRIASHLTSHSGKKTFYDFYLWRGLDYRFGKDVRLYKGYTLIRHYMDSDRDGREYVYPFVKITSQGGFAGGCFSGILMTLSYLFVVLRAISGSFGIGSVVKYASTIYQFAIQFTRIFTAFAEYAVAAGRQQSTLDYMNIPDVLYKGTLPVEKRTDNEYEIEFRNVSFRYPGSDTYSLRNVSLKFKVGQRLAVVGTNGSGKTTMIKLLCRLYDPTEGEILLNGINIKKYRYEEYMDIFSVVFQDFKLFSFSLGQNVATGVDVNETKARDCLAKAGFAERLFAMPQGLDTPLYKDFQEDGVEISGGEAQKIALARALYKDAPFIILDEPTAALDPVAEAEIYSKFNEIVGEKTAIYISHRLSSCRFCDNIIVFDQGKIVQQGSHDALVADENGRYHQLWNAQAQYYV